MQFTYKKKTEWGEGECAHYDKREEKNSSFIKPDTAQRLSLCERNVYTKKGRVNKNNAEKTERERENVCVSVIGIEIVFFCVCERESDIERMCV